MKEALGKINIKTIIFVVIGVLVLVLGVLGIDTAKTYLSGAAAGVEPVGVSVSAMETEATVTWTSEKASMGVIEYGTSPASLLLRAPETDSVTNHRVVLTPLRSGLSYYFRVRVGEEVFDNNGIPYSFKTQAGTTSPVPEPINTVAPAMPTSANQAPESTCSGGVDYNGDGVINSFDIVYCNQHNSGAGSNPTPTAGQSGECRNNYDYDGNGVINSFDQIWCRQNGGN